MTYENKRYSQYEKYLVIVYIVICIIYSLSKSNVIICLRIVNPRSSVGVMNIQYIWLIINWFYKNDCVVIQFIHWIYIIIIWISNLIYR